MSYRLAPNVIGNIPWWPLRFREGAALPRIPDNRLDIAVYFYPDIGSAKDGDDAGGCGFWFSHPFPSLPNRHALCVVTNRHVIEKCRAVRLNRIDGKPAERIDIEPENVFPHNGQHDLAIAFIGLDPSLHQFNHVPSELCLTMAKADGYKIGIGDDVYMIGRFIGHDGRVHNEPTARFGHISAGNRPMVNVDAGFEEDSYAVEMKSKRGYSGAAVMVYATPHTRIFKHPRPDDKQSFEFLLGILWGQISEKRPLRDADGKEIRGPYVTEFSGLSGVVPAWHLLHLMQQPEVQDYMKELEKVERERLRKSKAGAEKMAAEETKNSEKPHSHREDFNRLLGAAVKPPKSSDQT